MRRRMRWIGAQTEEKRDYGYSFLIVTTSRQSKTALRNTPLPRPRQHPCDPRRIQSSRDNLVVHILNHIISKDFLLRVCHTDTSLLDESAPSLTLLYHPIYHIILSQSNHPTSHIYQTHLPNAPHKHTRLPPNPPIKSHALPPSFSPSLHPYPLLPPPFSHLPPPSLPPSPSALNSPSHPIITPASASASADQTEKNPSFIPVSVACRVMI